jgi:hypothetical protein
LSKEQKPSPDHGGDDGRPQDFRGFHNDYPFRPPIQSDVGEPSKPERVYPVKSLQPQTDIAGLVERLRGPVSAVSYDNRRQAAAALEQMQEYRATQDKALRFYAKRHELDRATIERISAERDAYLRANDQAGKDMVRLATELGEAQARIAGLEEALADMFDGDNTGVETWDNARAALKGDAP